MKRRIKKEDLVGIINELDHRSETWSTEKMDRAIEDGFAELCTINNLFSSDVTVELDDYYESGETKFTINVPHDSVDIYDLYLVQDADKDIHLHGEKKFRNESLIYRDSRNLDVVNVDLNGHVHEGNFSSAVVKYFYIPTSNFVDMYISNNVYLALKQALGAAAYDLLNDVERASQKRAAMHRTASSVINIYPDDFAQPGKPSMFPRGV